MRCNTVIVGLIYFDEWNLDSQEFLWVPFLQVDKICLILYGYISLQVMKTCSKLSKIYLTAMVYELYKTGMGETTFEKVSFLSFSPNDMSIHSFSIWILVFTTDDTH